MKSSKEKKTRLRIIFAAAAVAILAALIFIPKKSKKKEIPPLEVKKETSSNKIEISGYIEAAEVQKLQAPGEGIIQTVRVKEGDKVTKNSLLFALDSTKQEYELAQQEFAIKQEAINGPSKKLNLMEQQKKLLE
ncbi:MAG: efflux RND transporter periplasmic adaptor subunit, partial [Treponema lecithinolyticum]